jgi:hypothetical protein
MYHARKELAPKNRTAKTSPRKIQSVSIQKESGAGEYTWQTVAQRFRKIIRYLGFTE